jgi:serine/threonine protein kinase
MIPPTSIAPYKITAKLGEGGVGAVHRAKDMRTAQSAVRAIRSGGNSLKLAYAQELSRGSLTKARIWRRKPATVSLSRHLCLANGVRASGWSPTAASVPIPCLSCAAPADVIGPGSLVFQSQNLVEAFSRLRAL